MKKFLEIMMIVFYPYIVIYRQKRQIRLLKSDMNYASKLWSIERDPKKRRLRLDCKKRISCQTYFFFMR